MHRTGCTQFEQFFQWQKEKTSTFLRATILGDLDPDGASPSNFLKITRWSYIVSRRSVLASQLQGAKER